MSKRNKNEVRQKLLRFKNLSRKELQILFNTEEKSYQFVKSIIWSDGERCPYCECETSWAINRKDRKEPSFKCTKCRKVYTLKTGTLLHSTKLSYFNWIEAIYYIINTKRGFPSFTLAEYLGVTEKTAWHLSMRIFMALDYDMNQPFDQDAELEIDEVFLSAKVTNKNKKSRKRILENQTKGLQGKSYIGKNIVLSVIDRKNKRSKLFLLPKNIKQKTRVKLTDEEIELLKQTKTGKGRPRQYKEISIGTIEFKDYIRPIIANLIPHKDTKVFTDEAKHYLFLDELCDHYSVNHSNVRDLDCDNEFVKYETDENGEVIVNTTNSVEGFFTHLSKTILGTHFHISRTHFEKYLSSISFRYTIKDLPTIEKLKSAFTCLGKSKHKSFNKLKMGKVERQHYMNGLSNYLDIA